MAIFGHDRSEWKYIGAISNKYDSNSIANDYGAGSKYDSDSINNDYGSFGGKYSSSSAFNEYTSDAPIIVDDNYKFIGYLTVNKYNTPNINTYEAIACANKSYTSSNSKMEDITFKKIPSSSSYGGNGYTSPLPTSQIQTDEKIKELQNKIKQLNEEELNVNKKYLEDLKKIQNLPQNTCPVNSILNNNTCSCNNGYVVSGNPNVPNGWSCVTMASYCINTYGQNIHPEGNQCTCDTGYSYDSILKTCKLAEVKKEVTQPVVIKKEPIKIVPSKTAPAIKPSDGLKKPIEKNYFDNIVLPKEEVALPINPEPIKKVRWYQKILNWFK